MNVMDAVPLWLLVVSAGIAAGALVMTLINLRCFLRSPRDARPDRDESITVCIPARNEQDNIEACVRAVLASDHPNLNVLVYDDQSADGTPRILARLRAEDPRVALAPTKPLPQGWVGKQWACQQLGEHAASDWLAFIDADVRLTPDCLRRALASAHALRVDLISTFPRQITGSLAESLLVPLIHFILLSYLPFPRMRGTNDPSASAGCGQFLMARADAYRRAGAHAAFKDSMHDGIRMPRAFRKSGFRTDLFDGTDIASCRMYRGLASTWNGFAKNAYEGLGHPALLVFLTIIHVIGHILPWCVLANALASGEGLAPHAVWAGVAVVLALAQRLILAHRFRQPIVGALLHPVGVLLMTLVQWHSFILTITGHRGWRGRVLSSPSAA